ncbi:MAG: TonB-dependent receptor [Rikenellaceae bacterium]
MKKLNSISLLALSLATATMVNGAEIKGTVVDATTKEPLIGATIILKDTNVGVTTDYMGEFIMNVADEASTVAVSYITYRSQEISLNAATNMSNLFIELQPDTQMIASVKVVAKANLETEANLNNQRIASNVAIENIGAREMSMKGLSDAQESVKKMTGISVAGSGQLVVRGLGDRYNITTLNGQPIASPNPDNKLIPLDIFPSSAVKNITVSKVYNATSYADYSGAHIDIATKDMAADDFFSVGFSVGGNTNTTLKDFYRMDNVSLFTQAEVASEVLDLSNDMNAYAAESGSPFETGLSVNKTTSLPVFGGNMAWGHTYKVGDQKLSLLASGGVSNDQTADLGSVYRVYEAGGDLNDEYYSDNYTTELKIAALATASITMRDEDRLSYTFFYARNASDEYSLRDGFDQEGHQLVGSNSVTHIYKLATHQLNAHHTFGDRWALNWSGSYTGTSSDEPDRRQVMYEKNNDDATSLSFFTLNNQETMRYFGTLDENEWNANLSTDYKFGQDNKLTLGASYKDKVREYDGKSFYYNLKSFDSTVSDNIFSDPYNADDALNQENLNLGAYSFIRSFAAKDTYDAGSTIYSAYVSTDLNFSEKWLLNLGLRMESSDQYVNYNNGYMDDSRDYKTLDLFPAINTRYALDDKSQLRLSISRTVTRPSFVEMAPFLYMESYGSAQIMGNEELDNGYNYNVDLRYEKFFGKSDMFSVTGYYKYLDSPIERVQFISGGGQIDSFENADQGLAAGVELELRKALYRTLALGFNASYMYTDVELSGGSYTNDSRSLQGASPYLANLDVTYAPKFENGQSISLALMYNLQGPRISSVGTSGRGDVYQNAVHKLNFVASYNISKMVQLSLKLSNLLNLDEVYMQEIAGKDVVVESHNYGIDGQIGVSLKF